MAADALALYITRSSATNVLTMQDKQVPVFRKEGRKEVPHGTCKEMIGQENILYVSLDN